MLGTGGSMLMIDPFFVGQGLQPLTKNLLTIASPLNVNKLA